MVAHTAADTGKRMILLEQLKGFTIFSLGCQGNETLYTDVCGTGAPARGNTPFAYAESTGNCLGIALVSGFSVRKAFVILTLMGDGTNRSAFTAARTFGNIDITRILENFCPEISRFAFKLQ
jgi:hypothetical protein